jgi:hypothetical protein
MRRAGAQAENTAMTGPLMKQETGSMQPFAISAT